MSVFVPFSQPRSMSRRGRESICKQKTSDKPPTEKNKRAWALLFSSFCFFHPFPIPFPPISTFQHSFHHPFPIAPFHVCVQVLSVSLLYPLSQQQTYIPFLSFAMMKILNYPVGERRGIRLYGGPTHLVHTIWLWYQNALYCRALSELLFSLLLL